MFRYGKEKDCGKRDLVSGYLDVCSTCMRPGIISSRYMASEKDSLTRHEKTPKNECTRYEWRLEHSESGTCIPHF